jgi:hypothetical protein
MATRVSLDISAPVTIYLGSPIVWARMIRWSTRSLNAIRCPAFVAAVLQCEALSHPGRGRW